MYQGVSMAKQERKKKRRRLSVRIFRFITLMVLIVSVIGITNSMLHSSLFMFRDWLMQGKTVVQTAAGALDYEKAKELSDVIGSAELKALKSNAASDEEYAAALQVYLEEKGVSSTMKHISDVFHRIERALNKDDVILLTCTGQSCRYTASSSDEVYQTGYPISVEFHVLEDEPEIVYATIEKTASGYPAFCTFTQMGEGTAGDEVLYVGCTRNVMPVLKEFGEFACDILIFILIVTVICALIGSLITRQVFAVPILKLKKAAEEFKANNSTEQSAEPVRADVHTRDEIEDLSDSLYDLECSVVETQQKLREEYIEKGRMGEQLALASGIQNGVLPTDFPENAQYDLYALMHPAKQVGGDFYDFFLMPDQEHLALVIGDVSDKGIAAALFMMAGKTTVRSTAMREDDPAKILEAVNNIMLEQNPMSMFITLWIGILDLRTGVLKTASAGHEYPFMALEGKPFELIQDTHGLVIGELPNMKYKTCTYQLHKGDRIFVYTDGATDAMNQNQQQIGTDHLLEIVQSEAQKETAKDIVLAVKEQVDDFSAGMAQFDDITILSLTYLTDPAPARPQKRAEIAQDILPLTSGIPEQTAA